MQTLEQAALAHSAKAAQNHITLNSTPEYITNASFQAGAEWQKEQYKEVIRLMSSLIGAYDIRYPDTKQLLAGYTNAEVITKITMELKRIQD